MYVSIIHNIQYRKIIMANIVILTDTLFLRYAKPHANRIFEYDAQQSHNRRNDAPLIVTRRYSQL